jgi:hypothetical protein
MQNNSKKGIVLSAVLYLLMFILASTCGLIHPACYAYVGTFVPLLFSFVYLYTAANIQKFGAATVLNGFVLIIGLIMGESNPAMITGLILLTAFAEIIRKAIGYDKLKGVVLSFIPFAFSFYAYSAHWWTNTGKSLAEAVEEMRPGYADVMQSVIGNTSVLILMLILTVPVAILGMKIAENAMKKQATALS